MYICPICNREFSKEEHMSKHLLACWREEHPYQQSKEAPHSEDIINIEVNNDVLDFFARFNK